MLERTVKFGVRKEDSGILELEMTFIKWQIVVVVVVVWS